MSDARPTAHSAPQGPAPNSTPQPSEASQQSGAAEQGAAASNSNDQVVIQLDGLTVRLGKREILHDLQASLRGRTIGLLGPNGAGKSTLIQTLLGFIAPSSGRGSIFGLDVSQSTKALRAILGYMPENDSFIAEMSAVSFVRLMGELSGLPHEAALERAHEVLFYVGLGEARYRPLGTYSLGMKQLAKLAQAIVHGPRLVILDEPTNGLDPPARQRMLRLIKEMRATGKMHLIICSHLLRDVEETCEEVLILKGGRIVHYSNLEEERRANKRFVELETIGNEAGFAEALAARGCELSRLGSGRLKMVVPVEFEMRELYVLAAERELQLRRVNYRRDSLEDIFLKAMDPRVADPKAMDPRVADQKTMDTRGPQATPPPLPPALKEDQ